MTATVRLAASMLVVAIVATPAHADDKAAAERYFRAGAKAYAAQNFAAAATDFDEAWKAMPLPEIAFSAAQAYRRLYRVEPKPQHVRRAVELYRAYLDKVKSGGRVGDAADNLAEMERELDKLKASGQSTATAPVVEHTRLGVSITVTDQSAGDTSALREIGDASSETAIKGLAATLDGKPVEPFALIDVDAKDHVIAVTADGYFPVDKKATAVTGQSQLIEVELRPKPAKVIVKTEVDAQIAVDGRAAATPLELAAGKHLITIVHRGREPFARELSVTRGQTLELGAPLAMTPRRRAVPWVFGGAAIAGGLAVTTGIVALVHDSRASDLRAAIDMGNRPPSDGDAYDHEVRSRDNLVTATWILGGAAIAGGALAAGLYWFDTPQPNERATERVVVPTVSNTSAGVSVVGRF
jgi:hypothetical protein